MDCTESNDEEEDEEEVVEKERCPETSNAPRWDDFFTTEMLTDSQNSQSQACCSAAATPPSQMTGSQTPELFSDEETDNNFSLTLSASLSNHSSQNTDPCFPDTVILQPERGDGGTDTLVLPSDPEQLPGSQASSDFDVPCTPESAAPQPEELLQLYRKLASGEEVLFRRGSQGSSWWSSPSH